MPALPPKQEQVPISRTVLARVSKAEDLEVHTCKARLAGVTVLDIRDYVPSTGLYGRGTTLPWNTETLKVLRGALMDATAQEKAEREKRNANSTLTFGKRMGMGAHDA